MLTPERHRIILEHLKQKEVVKITDLVEITSASDSTIRRDLSQLEEQQYLKRVHGGASLLKSTRQEQGISERSTKNLQDKKAIAQYAANLVNDGECIYLDAGTTAYQMIPFLNQEDIVVVTNGLTHINALLENNIATYLTGGFIKSSTSALIGRGALTSIENYRFDKCFMGVNGIHSQYGYTTPDPEEALIKSAAIQQSREAFVLADSSKIGEVSFSKIVSINAANIITTETDDDLLYPFISKTSVKVVTS